MTLKYPFKLIVVKCIFEFIINIAQLHKLQTVRMAEKNAWTVIIYGFNFQCQRGQVVSELYSRAGGSDSVSSNLCVDNFFFFVHFLLFSFISVKKKSYFFPFGPFYFILTAYPIFSFARFLQ